LNHLSETIYLASGESHRLGGAEWASNGLEVYGVDHLKDFHLEWGLPVWRYEVGGITFEKRILVPDRQDSVFVHYHFLSGNALVRLRLRVALNIRPHDAPVNRLDPRAYKVMATEDRYEIQGPLAEHPLRLFLYGEQPALTLDNQVLRDVLYRIEEQR